MGHLNPAVKLQCHPSVRLDVEVEAVELGVRVEAGEVLQLILREVEVRVGQGRGSTLALEGEGCKGYHQL